MKHLCPDGALAAEQREPAVVDIGGAERALVFRGDGFEDLHAPAMFGNRRAPGSP